MSRLAKISTAILVALGALSAAAGSESTNAMSLEIGNVSQATAAFIGPDVNELRLRIVNGDPVQIISALEENKRIGKIKITLSFSNMSGPLSDRAANFIKDREVHELSINNCTVAGSFLSGISGGEFEKIELAKVRLVNCENVNGAIHVATFKLSSVVFEGNQSDNKAIARVFSMLKGVKSFSFFIPTENIDLLPIESVFRENELENVAVNGARFPIELQNFISEESESLRDLTLYQTEGEPPGLYLVLPKVMRNLTGNWGSIVRCNKVSLESVEKLTLRVDSKVGAELPTNLPFAADVLVVIGKSFSEEDIPWMSKLSGIRVLSLQDFKVSGNSLRALASASPLFKILRINYYPRGIDFDGLPFGVEANLYGQIKPFYSPIPGAP